MILAGLVTWALLLAFLLYLGIKARDFRDRRDAADLAERQAQEST